MYACCRVIGGCVLLLVRHPCNALTRPCAAETLGMHPAFTESLRDKLSYVSLKSPIERFSHTREVPRKALRGVSRSQLFGDLVNSWR